LDDSTRSQSIAEEIEEPFGGDENDLPLHRIAHNIEVHIREILP
jgi:ion channel-forming bestrophin family protein